jgi:succinoglycan biosynthesis protein ExoV
VPHHRSEDYINWEPICRAAGVQLISARQGVEPFIQQLTSCKLVVSEAMHGAIFADALRIPWLPAKFSPAFREDKWLDWADSMSLDLHFHILPAVHDKPFPLGKRLEKTFKQLMSRFKVSGKLPEQSWKSGPLEVAKLIQALRC